MRNEVATEKARERRKRIDLYNSKEDEEGQVAVIKLLSMSGVKKEKFGHQKAAITAKSLKILNLRTHLKI